MNTKRGETLVTARPCCVSPHELLPKTLNGIFISANQRQKGFLCVNLEASPTLDSAFRSSHDQLLKLRYIYIKKY